MPSWTDARERFPGGAAWASATARPAPRVCWSAPTWTVMVGETRLSQIAERLGIPLQALIEANPNTNPGKVNAGQELRLPVQADSRAPQAPVTQQAPVTSQSQIKSQMSEFGLGGVMRELQLKQMLDAESTAKPPMFDGVKSADSDLNFVVDGKLVGRADGLRLWVPVRGKHRLELVGASGRVLDAVEFEIRGYPGAPQER